MFYLISPGAKYHQSWPCHRAGRCGKTVSRSDSQNRWGYFTRAHKHHAVTHASSSTWLLLTLLGSNSSVACRVWQSVHSLLLSSFPFLYHPLLSRNNGCIIFDLGARFTTSTWLNIKSFGQNLTSRRPDAMFTEYDSASVCCLVQRPMILYLTALYRPKRKLPPKIQRFDPTCALICQKSWNSSDRIW